MIRIGIVGAENSHCAAVARLINVQKKVPGCRVVSVWGERPMWAKNSAERGEIPEIVKTPADMVGKVDGVMVDHRHPKFHLSDARPLLEAKIPLFIDKPFCYRTKEGIEFLARAKRLKVPVTSFSSVVKSKGFLNFHRDAKKLGAPISVISWGSASIKSKYGGVFFYGIHQLDMVCRLLSNDITHVQFNRGQKNHTVTLLSSNGAISTVHLISEGRVPFEVSYVGEKGRLDGMTKVEEPAYLGSTKEWCRMFKTGKTVETVESMLTPVAVLEAIEKSVNRKGQRVKVAATS